MRIKQITEDMETDVVHAQSTRALADDIVMYAKSLADNDGIDITDDTGYEVWEQIIRRELESAVRGLQDHVLKRRIDIEYLAGQDGRARALGEDGIDDVAYKVFVNTAGDPPDSWATNGIDHSTVDDAVEAANNLFDRWTAVKYWRVMDPDKQTVYAEGP